MPTDQKRQLVSEVKSSLETSVCIYLSALQGLTVAEAGELRGALIEAGGRMQVVKNRLLRIAMKGTQFEPLADLLTGPNAVTYCPDDPIEPLKVLSKFAQAHNQPPVRAGMVEGRVLTTSELDRLSKVPSRDQLIAEVVGGFAGPVNDLVYSLSGLVSNLVFTIQAVADKKAGAEAA